MQVVSELKAATRGYLWRKGTSMFAGGWSRRFFIVHDDSITCHEDHMKTSKIELAVKLTDGSVTVDERADCAFAIVRDGVDVMVLRAEEDGERTIWAAAINVAASGGAAVVDDAGAASEKEEFLLESALEVRADKQRAAHWDLHFFTLTATTLRHYENEQARAEGRPIETFRLNPQCCVFEVNSAQDSRSLCC